MEISVVIGIIVVGIHVVVLSHTRAVSPLIVEGWVRRGNLVNGPLGQYLECLEEVGKVPRTVGLGHDVVLQVPWGLGLPEEDHALRTVGQRVAAGVMLQVGGNGHIRKLQWPVNARHKSISCLSRGTSVVLNHCLNVRR